MTTIRWKRRRRITSGGMMAESRCGRYRLYDFADGTDGAGMLDGACWLPIETRDGVLPRRYRTRSKAQAAIDRQARRKGGAR